MKRVTGIGGIFFKAKDAPALRAWYKQHLGIDVQAWGGAAFTGPTATASRWPERPPGPSIRQESDHFAPSTASFMVNYRVEDLHALLKALQRGRLQRAREDRRLRVREVRLGHRPGRQQGRTLATACRPMTAALTQ